jgi:hypothetical protein
VRGSHRRKRLRDQLRIRRLSDRDVLDYYGEASMATIVGPAGSGFIEDTWCIHKGLPPREKERLVLQIQFGLHDYGLQNDLREPAMLRRLV